MVWGLFALWDLNYFLAGYYSFDLFGGDFDFFTFLLLLFLYSMMASSSFLEILIDSLFLESLFLLVLLSFWLFFEMLLFSLADSDSDDDSEWFEADLYLLDLLGFCSLLIFFPAFLFLLMGFFFGIYFGLVWGTSSLLFEFALFLSLDLVIFLFLLKAYSRVDCFIDWMVLQIKSNIMMRFSIYQIESI